MYLLQNTTWNFQLFITINIKDGGLPFDNEDLIFMNVIESENFKNEIKRLFDKCWMKIVLLKIGETASEVKLSDMKRYLPAHQKFCTPSCQYSMRPHNHEHILIAAIPNLLF